MPVLSDNKKILEYDPNSIFRASKYISNISTANLENPARNPDIVDKKNPSNVDLGHNVNEFLQRLSEIRDNTLLLRGYVDENENAWRGEQIHIPYKKRPTYIAKQKQITIPQGTVLRGSGRMKRKPVKREPKMSLRSRLLKNNLGDADEEDEYGEQQEEKHSLLSLKEPPRFTKMFIQRPELERRATSNDIRADELNEGLTQHIAPFARDYKEKYIRKTYSVGDEEAPTIDERLIGGAHTDSEGEEGEEESESDDENTQEYYDRNAREADEHDLDRVSESDEDDEDDEEEDKIPKHNPILHLLTKLSTLLTNATVFFNGKIKNNFNKIDRLEVDEIDNALGDAIDEWKNINYSLLMFALIGGESLVNVVDNKFDKLLMNVLNAIKSYAPIRQGGGMHHYSGGTMMLTGFNKGQRNNPTKYLL
jgi:hypothetical protein